MPALLTGTLAGGTTTELNACKPICLAHVTDLALTVEGACASGAKAGLTAHVKTSCDGINYDTEDLLTFDVQASPGNKTSKTVAWEPKVMFVKVLIENLDPSQAVADVKVTATLGAS